MHPRREKPSGYGMPRDSAPWHAQRVGVVGFKRREGVRCLSVHYHLIISTSSTVRYRVFHSNAIERGEGEERGRGREKERGGRRRRGKGGGRKEEREGRREEGGEGREEGGRRRGKERETEKDEGQQSNRIIHIIIATNSTLPKTKIKTQHHHYHYMQNTFKYTHTQ